MVGHHVELKTNMANKELVEKIAMKSLQLCMDGKLSVVDMAETIHAANLFALGMLEKETYKLTIQTRAE